MATLRPARWRGLLQGLLLLATAAPGAAQGEPRPEAAAAQPPPRPSILLVYCDDLRFDILAAPAPFPAFQRLAAGGVRFDRSYVTTSRCCPSRATLLTGRPMGETGVRTNKPRRMPDMVTLPEVARAQGYRTAWFGKWHLPAPEDAAPPGFDQWAGYPGPGKHFGQVFTDEAGASITTGPEVHQADWVFERAVRFLEEAGEEPFFLVVAPKNPHTPLTPAPRHLGALDDVEVRVPASFDRPDDELPPMERDLRRRRQERAETEERAAMAADVRRYWELVMAVDEGLARLDAALEAAGRRASTLVVLTSDNGQLLGEHGFVQKGLAYDPSIRVPLLARFPGVLPEGERCGGIVLNVDLFPTLTRVMGATEAAAAAPGMDLLAVARGEVEARPRFVYEGPDFDGRNAIRAVVEPRLKYVRWNQPVFEALFDLEADPDEVHNLAGDPDHAGDLARLRALLD